jgi:hypothetical protein
MDQQKVATEVAEAEFARFLATFDLDWGETAALDDDERKSFEQMKAPVIRAMTRGTLVIDGNGEPVFTATDGFNPITFREPKGKAVLNNKGDGSGARMGALMVALTGESALRFDGLPLRDLKVCMAITNLVFTSR